MVVHRASVCSLVFGYHGSPQQCWALSESPAERAILQNERNDLGRLPLTGSWSAGQESSLDRSDDNSAARVSGIASAHRFTAALVPYRL